MKTKSLLVLGLASLCGSLAAEAAVTYRIYATREGLVGGTTANGYVIPQRAHFCALPSGTVLNARGDYTYTVTIRNPENGRVASNVPVWDVGPWNCDDNYWDATRSSVIQPPLPRGKPQAEAAYYDGHHGGKDFKSSCCYGCANRTVANGAGIDLGDGTFWDALGMVNNGWVDVTFNWVQSPCDINMTQGAIRSKYEALGGCNSLLGAPTTTERTTPNGAGKYNHFANNGSIYWTSAYGAWEIHGSIRDKWAALGWEAGVLGFPISDETFTPSGGGRYNVFQNGSVYWTAGTGAHNVQGAIRDKWAALGWEAGVLGFPTTDEGNAANGGKYNHFQGGSIYWSSATGAFSVKGAIKDKWASMGWENSCHGYPTSDEYDWNGGKRSDFQNGTYISWTSAGGAVSSCEVAKVNVILDNNAAGFTVTGSWSTGTSATDKYGANYRYRSTAAVSQPAQWAASLSSGGSYIVSACWAAGANRSATAPYTVYHSTGSTTVNKSQKVSGGSWQSLGTFNLNSGTNTVRLSCWTTTGFIVVADAIRWQQQ